MKVCLIRLLLLLALLPAVTAPAHAQGTAGTSLSGTVADTAGGVIPGVTVTAKNNATGATYETVTNASGGFSLPALEPGTYTVTVSSSEPTSSVMRTLPGVLVTRRTSLITAVLKPLSEAVTV